jgi:hypothetical protein
MSSLVLPAVFFAAWLFVFWLGSLALEASGMQRRKARFQALSAMTGTGYTTREAESVVNYPRRRTIVLWLMLLGNTGIIAFLVLLIQIVRSGLIAPSPLHIGIVVGFFLALILSIRFGIVDKLGNAIIGIAGKRRRETTMVAEEIVHQVGRYAIVRLTVGEEGTAGIKLRDTGLLKPGTMILAIERESMVLPFPDADQVVLTGDQLLCYGEVEQILSGKR